MWFGDCQNDNATYLTIQLTLLCCGDTIGCKMWTRAAGDGWGALVTRWWFSNAWTSSQRVCGIVGDVTTTMWIVEPADEASTYRLVRPSHFHFVILFVVKKVTWLFQCVYTRNKRETLGETTLGWKERKLRQFSDLKICVLFIWCAAFYSRICCSHNPDVWGKKQIITIVFIFMCSGLSQPPLVTAEFEEKEQKTRTEKHKTSSYFVVHHKTHDNISR